MKFGLGKSKELANKPLEEETLRRWREASVSAPAEIPPMQAELELDDSDSFQQEIPGLLEDGPAGSSIAAKILANQEITQEQPAQVLKTIDLESEALEEESIEQVGEASWVADLPTEMPQEENTHALPSNNQLSPEEDLQRRFGTRVKEAIGAGTVIEGKLSFDAPVRIDGSLRGEISSSSTLIVGEQGNIEADLQVGSAVIFGQVNGSIQADDLVEIRAGGILTGDIKTKRVMIEDGGIFKGSCNK